VWLSRPTSPAAKLSVPYRITLLTNVGRIADVNPSKAGGHTDLLVRSLVTAHWLGALPGNKRGLVALPICCLHVWTNRAGAIHTVAWISAGAARGTQISVIAQEQAGMASEPGRGEYAEEGDLRCAPSRD